MLSDYNNEPMTREAAKKLQSLDLYDKFILTIEKIDQWERATEGQWYVSFSGGKDSTVLAYMAAKYLDSFVSPPHPLRLLFFDTGLEFPEVRMFALKYPDFLQKKFKRLKIEFNRLRPQKTFCDVVYDFGYPIISKQTAQKIRDARAGGKWGTECLEGKRPGKIANVPQYKYLLDAPFLISDKCCNYMKKQPARYFYRKRKLYPVIATMADESLLRWMSWLNNGCNNFNSKIPHSNPMSFWETADVLEYILEENLPICKLYGDIMVFDGNNYYPSALNDVPLKCTGCQRTGCIFCVFGAHLEKGAERRFISLKHTHPKHWKFAIEGGEWDTDGMWKPSKTPGHVGLGLARVLDYIGVEYN